MESNDITFSKIMHDPEAPDRDIVKQKSWLQFCVFKGLGFSIRTICQGQLIAALESGMNEIEDFNQTRHFLRYAQEKAKYYDDKLLLLLEDEIETNFYKLGNNDIAFNEITHDLEALDLKIVMDKTFRQFKVWKDLGFHIRTICEGQLIDVLESGMSEIEDFYEIRSFLRYAQAKAKEHDDKLLLMMEEKGL